jgi:hypothetical protein
MAAGLAQDLYDSNPVAGPVAICDTTGRPRWNPIWSGNPAVWCPQQPLSAFRTPYIVAGGGCLPYLEYPYSVETGWHWTGWRARDHRGRLYLTPAELAVGRAVQQQYGSFLVVEPTSTRKLPNRRPPQSFWTFLVEQLRGSLALVQLAHPEAEIRPGLIPIAHADFREACGVLAASRGLVTTEGGLVHASAALGVPTVALFGGCISVEALGYPEHVNLVDDSPKTPCGALKPCDHCVLAWAGITPERTATAVQEMLRKAS